MIIQGLEPESTARLILDCENNLVLKKNIERYRKRHQKKKFKQPIDLSAKSRIRQNFKFDGKSLRFFLVDYKWPTFGFILIRN
ncbi:hypothetical protein BpHYR1_048281 [Brachionus plicatilis]|uniref:Uncharacterized protein n=1 Tax=Brachionus plicatilis TaxID=10195 RepID=A0A3M7QDQ9_BRAPC|nr:hypothetical protein BpHYR1_048281 [Brachionus plicatilis]